MALSTENPVTVQVVVVSKCFLVTHYSPFSTWKQQKNFFAAGSAEQLNSPQVSVMGKSVSLFDLNHDATT